MTSEKLSQSSSRAEQDSVTRFEMLRFGFDPDNPADVESFHRTDPIDPDFPVTDYSQDPFEYGSDAGQFQPIVVESDK